MEPFQWIIASGAAIALVAVALLATATRLRRRPAGLPTDWALTARPVFSIEERRAYRLLCEALPNNVVLSKLPLIRFCQPVDPGRVRFWYDLLGGASVTFAICSANGRVLAAVDLQGERGARRALQIKQAVLAACRIRYLRCPAGDLPSMRELQRLVPPSAPAATLAQQPVVASTHLTEARANLSSTVATRRAERSARWQDSMVFQDSFFAPDTRPGAGSEFATLVPSTPVGTPERMTNGAAASIASSGERSGTPA
jgi:hypothetical protein